MSRLFSVAIRNVLRNRRRSFFNALAMVAGVAMVVFINGFFNGFINSVVRGTIEGSTGAVQVHHRGFLNAESDPLKKDMPADAAFMARIASVPGVKAVSPRMNFEGLVNNGTTATLVSGIGYDPVHEYAVCPVRSKFEVDGAIPNGATDLLDLGAELATVLELKPGSSFTLLSAGKDGRQNALDATLNSRIESPIPFASKRAVAAPLSFVQTLLSMLGRVTEYALSVADFDQAPAVRDRVQAALGDEYEVITWNERDVAAAQFILVLRVMVVLLTVILFVLVLTLIVNTMLAAVYERVREIGTLLAVGVRRAQILMMFLIEAMTLAVIASAIGSAIGSVAIFYYGARGITLQPPGAKPAVMYPYITVGTVLMAVSISVVGAVLAALYPAFKASRLRPVEALRG